MDRLPKDYWGNEYVYKVKTRESGEFVIYSKGPDGLNANGLEDDVVLWKKEYNCKRFNDCYTFKDHVGYGSVLIVLLSFFLVLAGIVFQVSRYFYRKIKDNNAINSTR
jgi:hypothetical protein